MKNEFAGKKIILGVPNHFGLPERFKENLEFLGFEVFLLEFSGKFSLGFVDTLKHVSRKIFKKDKTYKAQKKAEFFEAKHIELLGKNKNFDFALIIRPDLYSKKTIKKIKEKASLSAAYQWDGLDRFPLAKEYIEDFDRFFVFDIRDLEKHPKCLPITNFYFDDLMDSAPIKTDVFFVGTFMKNRINEIVKLCTFFKSLNLRTKILLQAKNNFKVRKFLKSGIEFIKKPLSFKENMEGLKQARIVLDFKNDIHYGLSFRTFEAIGFSKKLITNNELVESYDFYNPKNILVLKENYTEKLELFLKESYEEINLKIVEKYGFSNWIKYVLDIEPYQKINLHYAKNQ